MMAELMGRTTGYCGGLGGSMHIADLSLGILGANGIVGAAMPLCTGAALASKLRESGQVAVAFFGDGASNQGVFHEAMNLASVWQLPLIFVCENNQYALTTPYKKTTSGSSIAGRAASYDIPGITIDGNDVEVVHAVAQQAIERARNGGGPALIEALTYRWGQHSMRANLADPRPDDEITHWVEQRDPLVVARKVLLEAGVTEQTLNEIGDQVSKEIEAAVDFGKAGAHPTMEEALASIYAPRENYPEPALTTTRSLSFPEAINEALHQEMGRDETVLVMGEDIGATGGIFQATKGLLDAYGPERVRDTPISEATFVGCGVGAAAVGMRPVVELQIFDFVTQAMDMIVNQAAKLRFMLGGKASVPLVVRGPHGAGIRMAAQHSQSLETWFTHIPGLVVVAPSTPYDAKGLLISSIRENNPVIFLESKLLYLIPPGPVPEENYAIPLGKGDIKRAGTDVTVVATMAMVPRAMAAAEQLSKEGISVEVIDPRTLYPLDEDLIIQSVKKTNRLVIAHEAVTQFGFGAEVLSVVVEKAFDWLDAPVARVGAPATPIPYADALEREVIPSQQRIVDAIRQVLQ
ncbi:MAG: dehydrogenase E1 component subunit alpha/beta, partial [Burkholderiaceae bacterium]